MPHIRKPAVAGQFYPADKTGLEEEVREYLSGKKGNIQKIRKFSVSPNLSQQSVNIEPDLQIKMAIVPHAGYMFSGKLVGEVIGRIEKKKDFIILGVNHSGIGNKISFSSDDFETPLGIVKNNVKLGQEILKGLKKTGLDPAVNE